MKRVLPLFVGILLLVLAAPAFAAKTMSAMGNVTAVSADSVTVKGKDA